MAKYGGSGNSGGEAIDNGVAAELYLQPYDDDASGLGSIQGSCIGASRTRRGHRLSRRRLYLTVGVNHIIFGYTTYVIAKMTPDLTTEDLSSLELFRAQYFQTLPLQELRMPPDSTLRKIRSQEWMYRYMFDTEHVTHLPQERYRARVLKQLVTRIEATFEDAEEDVRKISKPLT